MAQAYKGRLVHQPLYLSLCEITSTVRVWRRGPLVRGSHKEEHSNASRGRSRVGPHTNTVELHRVNESFLSLFFLCQLLLSLPEQLNL